MIILARSAGSYLLENVTVLCYNRDMESLLVSKGNKPRRGIIRNCQTCGKEMYVKPCFVNRQKYCSRVCASKGKIKGKLLICVICGNEYYRSPSQIKWRGSSCCSQKCRAKRVSQVLTGIKRLPKQILRGEKSPAWRGGKSSIYHRMRNSKEFKAWRKAVFGRDNYTCQDCGIRSAKGVKVDLHPHHIKSFTHFDELRFDVDNGITLCLSCHNVRTSWQRLGGYK